MNISAKTVEVEVHGNFVDGREIEAGSGQMLDVRNPATGEVIAKIPNSTADDVDCATTLVCADRKTARNSGGVLHEPPSHVLVGPGPLERVRIAIVVLRPRRHYVIDVAGTARP